MNTQVLTHKAILPLITIAGLLAGATVQAGILAPKFYENELDRCTGELRTHLNMSGATRLHHAVTDIEKIGVWYVFSIKTEVFDVTGKVTDQAATHCKSHRWSERTVVEVTSQFPGGNTRLASVD